MPVQGEVIAGKYRLLREIDRGGMGAIFEAIHEGIGKPLALKVLLPQGDKQDDFVLRFQQEAKAAAAVGHRGVVDVYDAGIHSDGSPYLVMELLRGRPLNRRLKEGPLEVPTAAYLGCQVLSALSAVHRAGIIHRDLKPGNIFLVETGAPLPEVKLLDFGIARFLAVGPGDQHAPRTATGMLLCTPFYMAPEQARGEKAIDHRADLYSLGAILYLCLTGQIPFHDDDVLALLEKIRSEAPIPPSKLRPGIPADLESAVLRALAKPRDHRFPDAGSMFDAIFPFVDVGAVSLVPPPVRLLPAASIPHLPAPAETTAPTLPLDLASEEQDQPTTPLHPGPRPVAEAPTQLIQPQADEPTLKPLVREPSPVRRSWRGAVLVGVSLTVVVFAALAWLIWPEPSSPPLPSAAATSAADEQPPPEEVQAESAPATPDASGAPEETTNSPDPASDGGSVPDWSEDAAQPGPLPPVRRENQRPEPAKRMRQKAVPRGYGSLIAVEPQEPEPPPPAPRSQGYGRLIHEGEESGAE